MDGLLKKKIQKEPENPIVTPVDENYKPTEDGENKLEAVWKEQEEDKTEVLTGETKVEGETINEVVEPPTIEEPPVQETEVIEVPTIEEVPNITM